MSVLKAHTSKQGRVDNSNTPDRVCFTVEDWIFPEEQWKEMLNEEKY